MLFNLPFCGYSDCGCPRAFARTVGKAMERAEWRLSVNAVQQLLQSMLFSSCYSQYRGQREQAGCFRLALFGNANVRRAKLLNLTWDLGAVEWHWERSYISKTNGDYVLKSWSVPRPKLFTSYCSAIVRNISRKLRA